MKRKWESPELIVLYRGKPEENLMQIVPCKNQPMGKNDPDNAAGTICMWEHGSRANVLCEVYTTS